MVWFAAEEGPHRPTVVANGMLTLTAMGGKLMEAEIITGEMIVAQRRRKRRREMKFWA